MAVRVMDLRQSRPGRAALRADREAHPRDDRRAHGGRQRPRGVRVGAAADRALLRGARGDIDGELRVGREPQPAAGRGPAPRAPVRDAHRARRPAAGRRLRGGLPPARARPARLRAAGLRRLRRLVRGGRAQLRAPARPVPPHRHRPQHPPRRRRARRRACSPRPVRPRCCSRPSCRRASTCRPATSTWRAFIAERPATRGAPTRARRPTGRCPTRADVAWFYPEPLREAAEVKDMVAFWDERVDVIVDGERRGRPKTHWYD